jgi:hypothetical protein
MCAKFTSPRRGRAGYGWAVDAGRWVEVLEHETVVKVDEGLNAGKR